MKIKIIEYTIEGYQILKGIEKNLSINDVSKKCGLDEKVIYDFLDLEYSKNRLEYYV